MMARRLASFTPLIAAMAFGCASPSAPTPGVIVSPIQVESLELVRDAPSPSGLGVRVQGILGDGCTDLLPPITQERDGTVVRIRILRQRPEDAVCIQIAKLFDQVVDLAGDYPAGQYTVSVNGSELRFSVP